MKHLLIGIFTLTSLHQSQVQAQDAGYARSIIEKMSNRTMMGRGYVRHGDSLAAQLVASEFKRFGLLSFQEEYLHRFQIPINTMPGAMALNIDGIDLEPGIDFVADPCANTGSARKAKTYAISPWLANEPRAIAQYVGDKKEAADKVMYFDETLVTFNDTFRANYATSIGVLQTVDPEETKLKGLLIITNRNLSWSTSVGECVVPTFQVHKANAEAKGVRKYKQVSYQLRSDLEEDYVSQNVIGYVKGKTKPDSFVVLIANYDHLGCMGVKNHFPGANNNASGTAMLLDLARFYSQPENQPEYSIIFAAYSATEVGLVGAWYAAQDPTIPTKSVKLAINLRAVGTGENGVLIQNTATAPLVSKQIAELLEHKKTELDISTTEIHTDGNHYYYSEAGIPALMVSTKGGEAKWNRIDDTADHVTLAVYDELFWLVRQIADKP